MDVRTGANLMAGSLGTITGTKKVTTKLPATGPIIVRGFGSTYGSGSTDTVESSYTLHNTTRTWALWAFRENIAWDNYYRFFDKRKGGSQVEVLYDLDGTSLGFDRGWSSLDGQWSFGAPSKGVWHHIILTYDAGSTANNPAVYVDGLAVSVTRVSAPSGSTRSNTDPYCIGNRASDNARGFKGMLGDLLIWNRLLSAAEALELYQTQRFLFQAPQRRIYVSVPEVAAASLPPALLARPETMQHALLR